MNLMNLIQVRIVLKMLSLLFDTKIEKEKKAMSYLNNENMIKEIIRRTIEMLKP